MDALDRAFEAAGGPTALAAALQIRQSVVSNWRMRGRIPAARCIQVEQLTGVSRHELRPDVFGEAPQGEPAPLAKAG